MGAVLAFLVLSIVSMVASVILVFRIKDFKQITKVILLRSVLKVLIGLAIGLLWSVYVNYFKPSTQTLYLSLAAAVLMGAIISLLTFKKSLHVFLGLEYKISTVLLNNIIEFVVWVGVVIVGMFIFNLVGV